MAKRKSKKQLRELKKQRKKIMLSSLRLIILVLVIAFSGYFLVQKFVLSSNINKKTANYISFRNTLDGTHLTINELKVLKDDVGKSSRNNSYVDFKLDNDGALGSSFDIVVTPINNKIDLQYIKYYLVDNNNNEVGFGNLYIADKSENGIIIHSGVVSDKNDKYTLKLWISDEYKEKDSTGNSFEVNVYLK